MSMGFKKVLFIGLKLLFPYLVFRLNKYFSKTTHKEAFFSLINYVVNVNKNYLFIRLPLSNKEFLLTLRRKGSDSDVFKQVVINGEYGRIIRLINLLPKKEKLIVVDAGANIGLFSIYASAFLPKASFICIEPNEESHQLLCINLNKNKIDVIKTYQKALWYKRENISFSNNFRDKSNWSYSMISANDQQSDLIETVTITDILLDNHIDIIDILKIDIEGAEKYLLEDQATLEIIFSKTQLLIIEAHEEVYSEFSLIQLLDRYGFLYFHDSETFFAIKRDLVY